MFRIKRAQNRVLALIAIIIGIITIGLFALFEYERRSLERSSAEEAEEKVKSVGSVVELQSILLKTFVYDYSYWDEMVNFLDSRDPEWAELNLASGFDTYKIKGIWVFKPDFELVYKLHEFKNDPLVAVKETLQRNVGGGKYAWFSHFFVKTDAGVLEVRSAPIQPSSDSERKTTPLGFLFAAKLLDDEVMADYSRILGGRTTIEAAKTGEQPPWSIDRATYRVNVFRTLPGPDEKIRSVMTTALDLPVSRVMREASIRRLTIFLSASVLIMLFMTAVLYITISTPLKMLNEAFSNDSADPVEPLLKDTTEFGDIARMMTKYFAQEASLREEIEWRKNLQETLADTSRRAGMYEVASGILHNAGNVLSSLNVSLQLCGEKITSRTFENINAVSAQLKDRAGNLDEWTKTDGPGKVALPMLAKSTELLLKDRDTIKHELGNAMQNLTHLNAIIMTQQDFGKTSAIKDEFTIKALINESLFLQSTSFEKNGIEIAVELQVDPTLSVEKHKLLQILMNLTSNARHALIDSKVSPKKITISSEIEGDELLIRIRDNGTGISAENLSRIFAFGFTTKKTGHGFGLHHSALIASELGGSLTGHSDGEGTGSVFTLRLPESVIFQAEQPRITRI